MYIFLITVTIISVAITMLTLYKFGQSLIENDALKDRVKHLEGLLVVSASSYLTSLRTAELDPETIDNIYKSWKRDLDEWCEFQKITKEVG